MTHVAIQMILYCVILIVLAVPLGRYMGKVMNGERTILSRVFIPVENGIYRLLRIDRDEEMHWKKYAACVAAFSVISLAVLWLILTFQNVLPLNPENVPGTSWHLGFNTAVSYMTNTDWQSYSPESALSYFSQMAGLGVENFVSAAVGIGVLFALIRGFIRMKQRGVGNFYTDVTRVILYVLIPLSLVMSLFLIARGVPQTFEGHQEVRLLEPVTVTGEDGTRTVVDKELIPLGPAGSQISIKQLGTNGGGFYGANSAHPLENPDPFSDLVEMEALLLIPAALCFAFGRNIKDQRQGAAIFIAMFLILAAALAVIVVNEQAGTPQLSQNGSVYLGAAGQAGGNMEGKETRFGIAASSTWAGFTTAAANGSVNSMHDSFTPIGGLVPMLLMMIGEVAFGGAGCGLYQMLAFAILTVFIAGLMVGRTPEYLGKKIEPFEMKMAVLACLASPVAILLGSGITALIPATTASLTNHGAHGLSEILYAFSSAGGNNGSAFAGFHGNTPYLNTALGLTMLFVRFLPMFAVLAASGSLAGKKKVAVGAGTLPTHNGMFIFLLIMVVLLVGALSFFPALSLGPVAEFFERMK